MKEIYKYISLLIGLALFSNMGFTQVVPFHCPDPQTFDIKILRTAQIGVNFEFVPRPGMVPAWSNISLHVSTSVPMGPPEKTNPVLHLVLPIMLTKSQYGDWTIVCKYQESGKYTSSINNVPISHLTLKHEQFKDCKVRDAHTIHCQETAPAH